MHPPLMYSDSRGLLRAFNNGDRAGELASVRSSSAVTGPGWVDPNTGPVVTRAFEELVKARCSVILLAEIMMKSAFMCDR
ncbi:hypothetical protein PM082_021035 [Marasmius tenuissimus]|nr:hypothetical protein PM082_021035 [Marasmius tenuissimus]